MILNEFDCNKTAVINAFDIIKPIKGFPKIAVTCFARFTFDRLVKELNAIEIASTSIANMDIPIYKAMYQGVEVALFMSYVGAAGCVARLCSSLRRYFCNGFKKIDCFRYMWCIGFFYK